MSGRPSSSRSKTCRSSSSIACRTDRPMPTREAERPSGESTGLAGRDWWLGCALVLVGALLATVPTVGDIGLTWDEPSYRTSQLVSAHWWEGLREARSRADLDALL